MLQFTVLPVTPLRQNATLIWDDETLDAVLTDVGGDVDYLLNEVAKRGLKLTAVWLTHGYFDHIGGVAELLKKQSVQVYGCHRDDAYLFVMLPEIAARYGMRAEQFSPTQFLDEKRHRACGQFYLSCFAYTWTYTRFCGVLLRSGKSIDCRRCVVSRINRQNRFSAWRQCGIVARYYA